MNKETNNYDYICTACNGLVAQPNKVYGWGGTFCNCTNPSKPPQSKVTEFHSIQPITHNIPWDEELKRQCEIRHLPYEEVKYLVDEVVSQAKESTEREVREAIKRSKTSFEDADYYMGWNDALTQLEEIIDTLSPHTVTNKQK